MPGKALGPRWWASVVLQLAGGSSQLAGYTPKALTDFGHVLYTCGYLWMSLCQLRDLYSTLGKVHYACVAGGVPIKGPFIGEFLLRIL